MGKKSGFKEVSVKGNPGSKDANFSKYWDFSAPAYDQRTSCFITAGTDYGVGKNQPVGHSGDAKQRVPCMPFGRVNTMKIDET